MNLKRALIGLAIVVGAVLVVAIGAAVVVLIAVGLGSLLSGFLSFSVFETALLAVIALIGALIFIGLVVMAIMRIPPPPATDEEMEDLLDEMEDDWENGDWELGDEDETDFIPPFARRPDPIRRTEFEKVGRNDPCPCGSGKKYKDCHGRAAKVN